MHFSQCKFRNAIIIFRFKKLKTPAHFQMQVFFTVSNTQNSPGPNISQRKVQFIALFNKYVRLKIVNTHIYAF
jgi:hypothetical protein